MSPARSCLAVCLLLAALVAATLARPADQTAEGLDAMPTTTLLAQDLDLMAQMGALYPPNAGKPAAPQERPPRASPLAHIIADIIDIKYQIGRAFLSRFFTLSAY